MTRITISVPEDVSEKAELRAKAENRSVSSYVSLLMVEDLKEHGLLPVDRGDDHAKFLAKVDAAAKRPKVRKKLERVLASETRERLAGVG
jgi:hypothetical protein